MMLKSIGAPEAYGASKATGFFPETHTAWVTLDTGSPTVDVGDILILVKGAVIVDGKPGKVAGALALADDMETPINGQICLVALSGGVAADLIEVAIYGVVQMDTAAAAVGDLICVPAAGAVAGVVATGATGTKVIGKVLSITSPYSSTTPLVFFNGFGWGVDFAAIAS